MDFLPEPPADFLVDFTADAAIDFLLDFDTITLGVSKISTSSCSSTIGEEAILDFFVDLAEDFFVDFAAGV